MANETMSPIASGQRRYTVSGSDADGDLHTFETDDSDRAFSTYSQFLEDLEGVQLSGELDPADIEDKSSVRMRHLKRRRPNASADELLRLLFPE